MIALLLHFLDCLQISCTRVEVKPRHRDLTLPSSLIHLNARADQICNLDSLRFPDGIHELNSGKNLIEDISNVRWPASMEGLNLAGSYVQSIESANLSSLESLRRLRLGDGPIHDLNPQGLPVSLRQLELCQDLAENWPPTLERVVWHIGRKTYRSPAELQIAIDEGTVKMRTPW